MPRIAWHRPNLVLYVNDGGTRRPLVRWATTIGGWSDVLVGGSVVQRWKESDVGPRIWRDLYAAPTWIPPYSTPDRDLVKWVGPGRWEIFTHGGRRATGIDAVGFARAVAAKGAGEILLTSMDRDGTRAGFDLALTRAVVDAVGVPVIASGGVGTLAHLVEGVTLGGASAVLAASIFHFGTHSIAEARAAMAAAGIAVRQA